MDDLSGRTIRGYDVQEQIGAGGYGAIYKAYQPAVNREVAVKVILPQHANKPEFTQRFESEARLIAQLEHPHIVPLYDFWQDDDGAFLVMRWLRGGSLREALERDSAWPWSKIAHLLDQIAAALDVAHAAGVVHRDLKPENILLDERGNAYLTDFGIAKDLHSDSHLTDADAIVGSPAYFSPEQIRSEPVTAQADIYSLGMMLYEILVGEHPFADAPPITMVMKHLQEALPSLGETLPNVPKAVHQVIERATAKNTADRYPDALSLAADFRLAFTSEGQTVQATEAERQQSADPAPASSPAFIQQASLTPDQRNRQRMLDKVRSFWVEGVLENSLYGAALLELGMEYQPEAVEYAWEMVLQQPDRPNHTLPPGIRITDVFSEMHGELLILGDPGSGKTTTLLELARELIAQAQMDPNQPMPVMFNLSSWADERKPLAVWLIDELNTKYQIPRKIGKVWVEAEQVLPLLDGLDEVKQQYRDVCVETINAFRQEHGLLPMVVCSRIADYQALSRRLKLQGAIVLQPLTRDQVDAYLARVGDELTAVRTVLDQDEKLARLVRTPLMLSIVTLAYRGLDINDIPTFDTLEGRRRHLFDTYVERMLRRRGIDEQYTPEQTRHYLTWLAGRMSNQAQSVYYIENMQRDWLQKRWQRILYSVGNRVFTGIPGALLYGAFYLVFGVLISLLAPLVFPSLFGSITNPLSLVLDLLQGSVIGGVVGSIIGGLTGTIIYFFRRKIQAVETLSWSGRRAILGGAIFGLTFGLFSVLLINSLASYWYADHVVPWPESLKGLFVFRNATAAQLEAYRAYLAAVPTQLASTFVDNILNFFLVGALTGGIVGAVIGGLTGKQIEMRTEPNQGIRRSFQNSWRIGLAYIFLILLVFLPAVGVLSDSELLQSTIQNRFSWGGWLLVIGVIMPFVGLLVSLSNGGYAVAQHVVLRLVLWRTGQTPRNIARFLNYAAERILMRKVGGGYIFTHRMLLDHFAESGRAKSKISDFDEGYAPLPDLSADEIDTEEGYLPPEENQKQQGLS